LKIWKLGFDGNYENVSYKDDKYFEYVDKNFRGEKMADSWTLLEIETYYKGKKAKSGEKADVLNFDSIPVFTKRAVDVFKDELQENAEILPLKHDEYCCFAINVIRVLDCLDEKQSDIQRLTTGIIFRIKKYVFKKEIEYPPIFKITTDGKISTFVTEQFIEKIEKNRIIGLACPLVWDSGTD
jgi:hypothetical protein